MADEKHTPESVAARIARALLKAPAPEKKPRKPRKKSRRKLAAATARKQPADRR
jgi:hypothetical protein